MMTSALWVSHQNVYLLLFYTSLPYLFLLIIINPLQTVVSTRGTTDGCYQGSGSRPVVLQILITQTFHSHALLIHYYHLSFSVSSALNKLYFI